MKRLSILTFAIVCAILPMIPACEKSTVGCSDNEQFCTYVKQQDFESTGPIIDRFLKALTKSQADDVKMERLRDWLVCKSCIIQAEIFCVSCIETYPPQSELIVLFEINGQSISKTMDISMGEELKFVRYHD